MNFNVKEWSTKKLASIVLMVLALLMLNVNWIKFDSEVLDEIDDMKDRLESQIDDIEDRYDDLDEYLDEEGFSKKEIKAMKKAIKATNKMVDTLTNGKYSVWSVVSLRSSCNKAKDIMSNKDSFLYDRDAVEAIDSLRLVFGIYIAVFAFAGILMILAIVSHLKDKKGLGIYATILPVLLFLIFGILHLGMNSDGSIGGITLAPVLTPVFAIASCVAWAGARKQTEK